MKIAITSSGESLDSMVCEQFGRTPYFIILDPVTMEYQAVVNTPEQLQSGAGPKAAELILSFGAEKVLTGHVGDKAEAALKKGHVEIHDGYCNTLKVIEAIEKYKGS